MEGANVTENCLPCLLRQGHSYCVHCEEPICDVCVTKMAIKGQAHCYKCYDPCKTEMEVRLIPIRRSYLK
jgi:hypothetical protein